MLKKEMLKHMYASAFRFAGTEFRKVGKITKADEFSALDSHCAFRIYPNAKKAYAFCQNDPQEK